MKDPLNILLTRSTEDNRPLVALFRSNGLDVLSLPMIEIRDLPFDATLLPAQLRTPLVLVTSQKGMERWLGLRRENQVVDNLSVRGYLLVGKKSAALLLDEERDASIIAVADSVEELLEEMIGLRQQGGLPVGTNRPAGGSRKDYLLYPCSRLRRDIGVESLERLGYRVVELPLYEPYLPDESLRRLPRSLEALDPRAVLVFYSPSAVDHFFEALSLVRHERAVAFPSTFRFAAIGPTTAESLAERGIDHVIVPPRPDSKLLVQEIRTVLKG